MNLKNESSNGDDIEITFTDNSLENYNIKLPGIYTDMIEEGIDFYNTFTPLYYNHKLPLFQNNNAENNNLKRLREEENNKKQISSNQLCKHNNFKFKQVITDIGYNDSLNMISDEMI